MFRYTQITNVSFVDVGGTRLWVHFILIDEKKPLEGQSYESIRQIRGFTYGGVPVFTIWIEPQEDVELKKNSFSLEIVTRNSTLMVGLSKDMPIQVEEIDVASCPSGMEVDKEILKYAKGSNYPLTVWLPIEQAKMCVINNNLHSLLEEQV